MKKPDSPIIQISAVIDMPHGENDGAQYEGIFCLCQDGSLWKAYKWWLGEGVSKEREWELIHKPSMLCEKDEF